MNDLVLKRSSPIFIKFHDSSDAPHFYSTETYGKRTVRHYELEYILSAKDGYIVTDNIPVPLSQHDILFRYPGMEVEGIGIYHSLFIEFDLNQMAETSDSLKKIPVILHDREKKIVDETLFHTLRLLPNSSEIQLLLWKSDILRLLSLLLQEIEHSKEMTKQENRQLQKIRKGLLYIQEHYAQEITIEQLASLSGYSPFYFCRLFKSITQLTPIQYVTHYRIQKAREQLLLTDDKAETIMMRVGFHNYGYFWQTFKRIYGLSPQEYRRNILLEKQKDTES